MTKSFGLLAKLDYSDREKVDNHPRLHNQGHLRDMQVILKGQLVDNETRCQHYATKLDIIALKFKCCDVFYPCYECHTADSDHDPVRWAFDDIDVLAILCGGCSNILSIKEYLQCDSKCPSCKSKFNPKCALHYDLYFEPEVFQNSTPGTSSGNSRENCELNSM